MPDEHDQRAWEAAMASLLQGDGVAKLLKSPEYERAVVERLELRGEFEALGWGGSGPPGPLPGPAWFNAADLLLVYGPAAWLGHVLAVRGLQRSASRA